LFPGISLGHAMIHNFGWKAELQTTSIWIEVESSIVHVYGEKI